MQHDSHAIMASLHSNGQAIMFYSCDLLFIIFYALIFEAEEHCPTGPLPGCWNVV